MKFKKFEEKLLDAGRYSFVVTKSAEKVDDNGKPASIVLSLKVWNTMTPETYINAWLSEDKPLVIRGFCAATGLEAKYDAEELTAEDAFNKTGELELGEYVSNGVKRNTVRKWIPKGEALLNAHPKTAAASDKPFDDDLPF